jgi:benzoyl-CoA reductase/2-hydroxyglutaryl-CoA dehydratase subunit BcrC/BadD/HgdB
VNDGIYKDFLRLAAFDEGEIPGILPDWRMAAEKLGLSREDVEFAIREWLPTYWDLDSLGIRKLIGAWMREAIDICKANEYKKQGTKIVYGILPAQTINYLGVKIAGGDRVYVSFPDIVQVYILNGFFHKIEPFLNAAETDGGIVYGCRHCALNKTRIASRMNGIIPSPDVIWTWGFNCDEGPKTDEYINCYIDDDWKVEITRIPHDTHFGEVDDENVERTEYLAAQMKYSLDKVQEITDIIITPEAMDKAVKSFGRLAMKVGNLQRLVCTPDPVTLDGSALHLAQNILFIPFNTGLSYMEDAVDQMTRDAIQRVKDGVGVAPKGAPKLGAYFVPAAVPWVNKIFKNNGVAMTFSMVVTLAERQMKPPSYEDPYMASAEAWLRMGVGMNMGLEVEDTIEKVLAMKPDAMLMGFFDFDRWLGAHQKIMARMVEERTGVPHFYLECDFWEDRDYSQEALCTRIESISQVLKMRKLEQTGMEVPA